MTIVWKALGALCVGLFITLMDQSLVAVALPQITEDLGASVNQAVWVSAIYLLTFAVPLLVTGRLGDRYGQRNVYLVGMAVFTLAATACAFAPTIEWLIFARAIQGLGASLLNPQPLSIINRIFPVTKRGAAMGVWSAVASSSGLFGPVVGGFLVGLIDWRSIFFLYIPFGLLAFILVALWVPKLPTAVSRIDPLSAALSLIAVLAIVVTLQQGPELGWPLWLFGLLAVGLAALIGFIWLQFRAQRRGQDALVPPKLFSINNFRWGAISVSTLGFAVYSMNLPIMLYLQLGAGMSAQAAGLLMLPMAAVSVVSAPLLGRLTDRLPPGRTSKIGLSSMMCSMALFAILIATEVHVGWLVVPMIFQGAANAMSWSANSAISMRQLPPELVGAGSGVYNTSRQVGAVIGAAALGAMMQINVQYFDFSVAMGLSMVLHVFVLGIGLLAVSQFRQDLPQQDRTEPTTSPQSSK